MMAHLAKLQAIADAHDGNRAVGTPGYDDSAGYVADVLRAKGFDVQATDFDLRFPFADFPVVTVGGSTVAAKPLEYTVGTGPRGVTGPLLPARVEDSSGCTVGDYDGLPVRGAVVLVDRGTCPFGDKQVAAAQRGAVALIVADTDDDDPSGATLGAQTDVRIPTVIVSRTDGQRLRGRPATTTITLNAGTRTVTTRNVVAQTKTGATTDVVAVGAHLDGVPAGPGINDDGSSVAAVLETALQMGSSPPIHNAARFGFWAAEEVGLLGSTHYVQSLNQDQLRDVALYLNFDMLASPNPAYLTMDGDQSARPAPQRNPPRVPEGSAGIERTLVAYLATAGKTARDTSFEGRSDYDPFVRAGIPAGGIFTGAEGRMTAEEAALWNGTAGQPYDPNYHQKTDTLHRIDKTALGINGQAAAYAVALYAQDLGGRNGVPVRDDRTRHGAADVAFAREMIPHHQQAVVLAAMVPARTGDPALRSIATQIGADQQAEVRTLTGLLTSWHEPVSTDGTAPGEHVGMAMTGMVDQATMDRLTSLTDDAFDTLWVTSMIGHHQVAIAMAQTEIAHGQSADAVRVANLIITAQQREIALMTHLFSAAQ